MATTRPPTQQDVRCRQRSLTSAFSYIAIVRRSSRHRQPQSEAARQLVGGCASTEPGEPWSMRIAASVLFWGLLLAGGCLSQPAAAVLAATAMADMARWPLGGPLLQSAAISSHCSCTAGAAGAAAQATGYLPSGRELDWSFAGYRGAYRAAAVKDTFSLENRPRMRAGGGRLPRPLLLVEPPAGTSPSLLALCLQTATCRRPRPCPHPSTT